MGPMPATVMFESSSLQLEHKALPGKCGRPVNYKGMHNLGFGRGIVRNTSQEGSNVSRCEVSRLVTPPTRPAVRWPTNADCLLTIHAYAA